MVVHVHVEITGEIEVIYKVEKLHWDIATLCPGLGKPCRLTNYYIQFGKLDGFFFLRKIGSLHDVEEKEHVLKYPERN